MVNKKSFNLKKIIFGFAGASILALAIFWYMLTGCGSKIIDFDYERDSQEIYAIFERDWYWLIAADPQDYSVEFMLKYRAAHQTASSLGSLIIKVLRECDALKGFVAYYKEGEEGHILYLDVVPDARTKGYGKQLIKYALDDLVMRGSKYISIVTRPSNEPALKVYKKMGFKETKRDQEFVYLEFRP